MVDISVLVFHALKLLGSYNDVGCLFVSVSPSFQTERFLNRLVRVNRVAASVGEGSESRGETNPS